MNIYQNLINNSSQSIGPPEIEEIEPENLKWSLAPLSAETICIPSLDLSRLCWMLELLSTVSVCE